MDKYLFTMKHFLFIVFFGFIIFGYNVNMYAQNYTAQNGSLLIAGSNVYANFDVRPGGEGISDSKLTFEKKSVKELVRLLKKSEKKAKKWAETAKHEGVKDLNKCIFSYANHSIDVFSFFYKKNGKFYGNETHKDLSINDSYFKVDEKGDCYVWIPCDLDYQEVSVDNSIQSTTSISNIGMVSQSSTREKEIHKLGLFTIDFRVDDFDMFLNHLNHLIESMDNAEKSIKNKNKLFK